MAQRRSGGVSVTQPVTVRSLQSAKCWSEWQDFDPLVPNEVRYQTTLHSGSLEGAPPISTRDPQRRRPLLATFRGFAPRVGG